MANESDEQQAAAASEVSDAALDAVVGGFNPQPDPPKVARNSATTNPVVTKVIIAVQPGQ